MKISCIAIDDEPLALDLLCKFIQQTTFLELEGKFSNAIEALGYINQYEVNLIFMDIQMPDLSGMELARILDGKKNSVQTRVILYRLSSICLRRIQGRSSGLPAQTLQL
jgi:YesN/AraC family two-component response regulator